MDPFEVRMQFLELIRRLNASQGSIAKVVRFALKYFAKCGEDIWDCVVEECEKGSINARINILYMLDSLCEASIIAQMSRPPQQQQSSSNSSLYVEYISKDLPKIVDIVVPESREGLSNIPSTTQILLNWRAKRVIDASIIDSVVDNLEKKKERINAMEETNVTKISKQEVTRRIEEDRERHKRLRERRWVQPIPPPQYMEANLSSSLASFDVPEFDPELRPEGGSYISDDIEFENAWETTSDWNEDDEEDVKNENSIYYACVMEDRHNPRAPTPPPPIPEP